MKLSLPHKLGKYRGRQYYRFFVVAAQSGLDREIWSRSETLPVISHSAVEAVRLVQEEIAPLVDSPTEFKCAGPKGGVTYRYTGYEGMVWARMCRVRSNETQLELL